MIPAGEGKNEYTVIKLKGYVRFLQDILFHKIYHLVPWGISLVDGKNYLGCTANRSNCSLFWRIFLIKSVNKTCRLKVKDFCDNPASFCFL